MKYRLYVSGFCNERKKSECSMGIGGVILNDTGYEKIFSKYLGKGTTLEANVYGIIHGINEVKKDERIRDLTIYSTNLMIINYLNKEKVEMPKKIESLAKNLIKDIEKLEITIKYEYFEINDYKYVRNLAEEAIKI